MAEEEFENFMIRVNQVSKIVEKLASNDAEMQAIGDLEAKQLLGDTDDADKTLVALGDDLEDIHLETTASRTVINREVMREDYDANTMSQEAFKRQVERDAKQRYEDKRRRKERMETLKKRASLACQRGEFEKALSLYGKAISMIRDNPVLYLNRATIYFRLELYDEAKVDLEKTLELSENSLNAWLLLAKIHHIRSDVSQFEKCVQEARTRCPYAQTSIDIFVKSVHELGELDKILPDDK